MGLIRAALSAATGNLGDQWKEFFYCEAMDKEVLLTKGVKQTRFSSSNKFASDNLITNGSGIAVADGQCMIIVDNGKIVELCAEPGQYTFDQSSEGTIFQGALKESIMQSLANPNKYGIGGTAPKPLTRQGQINAVPSAQRSHRQGRFCLHFQADFFRNRPSHG